MADSKPPFVRFLKRLVKNYFAVASAIFGALEIALFVADALIPAFELPPLMVALFLILLPLLLLVACYQIYSDDQALIESLLAHIQSLEDVRANLHCTIEEVYFYPSCESSGYPFKRRVQIPCPKEHQPRPIITLSSQRHLPALESPHRLPDPAGRRSDRDPRVSLSARSKE